MRTSDAGAQARSTRAALELLPWLAAALSCAPLVVTGFPRGHDFSLELLRALEYGRALGEGQLPPYWAPNVYGGYGSPIFLYYAPVFSALTTALAVPIGSVASAGAWVLALASFAGAWIARSALADATGDAAAARVGAALWILSPYLIGDKLIRNADAELTALCLAPLVLRGILLADTRPRASLTWLACGLALVILSHNLTALVIAASALGVALAVHGLAPHTARERAVLGARVLAGLALGVGLAAWFWLPALTSLAWVRPEELVRGKFEFERQWQSAAHTLGYARFFSAGACVPLALAAGGLAALRMRASRERRLLLAALFGAIACLFVMHPASAFVWRTVPSLPLFQFPWRFVGPLSLCAVLAAALAFAHFTARWTPARRRVGELAICAIAALNALPQLARGIAAQPYEPSELARALAPESVRALGLGVTVYDEYLPRVADPGAWRTLRPLQGPLIDTRPPARIDVEQSLGTRVVLRVEAPEPTRIRIARWAFPGWIAHHEGVALALQPNRHGVVEVEVPASGRLELELRPPPIRAVGLALGAASLLVLCGVIWLTPRNRAGALRVERA